MQQRLNLLYGEPSTAKRVCLPVLTSFAGRRWGGKDTRACLCEAIAPFPAIDFHANMEKAHAQCLKATIGNVQRCSIRHVIDMQDNIAPRVSKRE